MVFHRSLNDSKLPQVTWTFLSIQADVNNVVALMVSILTLISNTSNLLTKHSLTFHSVPITIDITACIIFFISLGKFKYLFLFSFYLTFILWSAGIVKSKGGSIFVFFMLIIACSDNLKWDSGIPDNVMNLILHERFWFMHVPFSTVFIFHYYYMLF